MTSKWFNETFYFILNNSARLTIDSTFLKWFWKRGGRSVWHVVMSFQTKFITAFLIGIAVQAYRRGRGWRMNYVRHFSDVRRSIDSTRSMDLTLSNDMWSDIELRSSVDVRRIITEIPIIDVWNCRRWGRNTLEAVCPWQFWSCSE